MKYCLWSLMVLALSSIAPTFAQDTSVTECEAGFRLIEHFAGTDCIP